MKTGVNLRSRSVVVLALVIGVGVWLGFSFASRSQLPLANQVLTDVTPHPSDPTKIFAVSEKGLYIRGENKDWKRLFAYQEKSSSLRRLITHPHSPNQIFLLTEEGVLAVTLKDGKSKWIYREINPLENHVNSLAIHPEDFDQLYLGTDRGLFRSSDGGKTWLRPYRWPENQRIEFVSFFPSSPPTLLLGTENELFFSRDRGKSFESGFSLRFRSEDAQEENGEETAENSDQTPGATRFTSLAFSSKEPNRIWVGTSEGIFESRDNGMEWVKLPDRGLSNLQITDLAFSDRSDALFAATHHEVARFHFDENRWESIPLGLAQTPTSLSIQPLPEKKGEVLLIGSSNQILEQPLEISEIPTAQPVFIPSPERMDLFRKAMVLEPTIQEVQKAAIRYGDLGNGKIKRWHWGSRLRAFIPDLSFGKDFSLGNNVDVDRGSTNSPDTFMMGPDDINKGWDFNVNWELGDLLYSTAQTSIDSRAKLLVELRESILSQVTRIYYERRRAQMEIALSPPQMNSQEYFDLVLRLEELTAQIDALTDGYFSRRLEEIFQEHPEVKQFYSS